MARNRDQQEQQGGGQKNQNKPKPPQKKVLIANSGDGTDVTTPASGKEGLVDVKISVQCTPAVPNGQYVIVNASFDNGVALNCKMLSSGMATFTDVNIDPKNPGNVKVEVSGNGYSHNKTLTLRANKNAGKSSKKESSVKHKPLTVRLLRPDATGNMILEISAHTEDGTPRQTTIAFTHPCEVNLDGTNCPVGTTNIQIPLTGYSGIVRVINSQNKHQAVFSDSLSPKITCLLVPAP